MGYKLGLLAGVGAGYVLGARAGRTRYEQIKKQSLQAWNSEPVQTKVAQATDAAQAKVVDAAEAVKAKAPAAAHGLVDKAVSAVVTDDKAGTTPGAGTSARATTADDAPAGPAIS